MGCGVLINTWLFWIVSTDKRNKEIYGQEYMIYPWSFAQKPCQRTLKIHFGCSSKPTVNKVINLGNFYIWKLFLI